jgi:hypothetical protein
MPTTPKEVPWFVEPPILPSKSKVSSTNFIESPVKVTKRHKENYEIFSPYRPTKRPKTYDFVESALSTQSKSRRTYRKTAKKPVKPRKKKSIEAVFSEDGGGFSDWGGDYNDGGDYDGSPEKCNTIKDGIDWSITDEEVERLKAKVVPLYWESLLDSPNSVVRVTERLYVLRDWNRSGYLMVTAHYMKLISLGPAIQACLQDD